LLFQKRNQFSFARTMAVIRVFRMTLAT
jgi:hypothetical protein